MDDIVRFPGVFGLFPPPPVDLLQPVSNRQFTDAVVYYSQVISSFERRRDLFHSDDNFNGFTDVFLCYKRVEWQLVAGTNLFYVQNMK